MNCQRTQFSLEYLHDGLYVVIEQDVDLGSIVSRSRAGNSPQKALARFQADGGNPDKVKIFPIMEQLMIPIFSQKTRGR